MEWVGLGVLVAPVEARHESGSAWGAQWIGERSFAAALVSALTLLAVAISGYHPYAEDGGLYLAGVKRLLDPALYPRQTAFVLEPMRMSLFAPAIAGLVRATHIGLPAALFALHLASVWVTLFAAWTLAERCFATRQARAGAVTLLACWLGLPVAGTALSIMDPYLTARSFSTPCSLLALVGVLAMTERGADHTERRRGFLLCVGSVALGGAMHPLMAMYTLGAVAMLACLRASRQSVRVWGTTALSLAALGIAACAQALTRPESADYVRVALTRSYWFLAEWRWYEGVGLAAPLVILSAVAWKEQWTTARDRDEMVSGARRALARMAVIAGATACVAAALFARGGAAAHLVARLQPLRAFQIVYMVMVLLLGAKLGERVLRRSVWRWGAAVMVLGGVMFGAARVAFPDSNHLELPGVAPRNAWTQAFLWVRHNTPKGALFALDADYIHAAGEDAQSFRAITERSALPDYSKDGGEASIAPELTAAWTAGQAAQQGLSAAVATDAERVARLRPLGVTWVVLGAEAATSFDCPYRNNAVQVCRLP